MNLRVQEILTSHMVDDEETLLRLRKNQAGHMGYYQYILAVVLKNILTRPSVQGQVFEVASDGPDSAASVACQQESHSVQITQARCTEF